MGIRWNGSSYHSVQRNVFLINFVNRKRGIKRKASFLDQKTSSQLIFSLRIQRWPTKEAFVPVFIWGSLVKFQAGGVVLKNMLCARVRICRVFVPGLTPVFQSSMSPSN